MRSGALQPVARLEHLVAAFAAFLFGGLVSSVGSAQNITTDGTLGAKVTLAGPSYPITAGLGKQVGGNLFHSVGVFGLNKGESATVNVAVSFHASTADYIRLSDGAKSFSTAAANPTTVRVTRRTSLHLTKHCGD